MAIELILSPAKHRVRLATHDEFEDFVVGQGRRVLISRLRVRREVGQMDEAEVAGRLEFFPIGGDPKELMAYMVKSEWDCIQRNMTHVPRSRVASWKGISRQWRYRPETKNDQIHHGQLFEIDFRAR